MKEVGIGMKKKVGLISLMGSNPCISFLMILVL